MKLDSIGQKIREYRISRNLHQDQLAEKSGLSTNYIGMVERGEKIPSLETFLKIANALNVSADMLLVDVLYNGYEVKDSVFSDKLERVAPENRQMIYDVVDTMLKHSKKIL